MRSYREIAGTFKRDFSRSGSGIAQRLQSVGHVGGDLLGHRTPCRLGRQGLVQKPRQLRRGFRVAGAHVAGGAESRGPAIEQPRTRLGAGGEGHHAAQQPTAAVDRMGLPADHLTRT